MSLYTVVRNDIRANGSIIEIPAPLGNLVALDIRGTFVGTLQFETTIDGINWFAVNGIPLPYGQNTLTVTSTTGPGAWLINACGSVLVRVRASAWTSGNASIVARVTEDDNFFTLPSGVASVNATPTFSSTTGSFSITFHLISAATTNATVVKGSAGTIGSMVLSNSSAAAKYVKIYNKATAPTVGTDTPVLTILVPAGGTETVSFFGGLRLSAGIGIATTGGITVADTTAVALNDLSIHLNYI